MLYKWTKCRSKDQHSHAFCKLQGIPVNIIVGSHVWVEDPEVAWIDGEVEKINGEEVVIQATIGKTVRHLSP